MIDTLKAVAQLERFDVEFATWQDGSPVDPQQITNVRQEYLVWYNQILTQLPEGLQARFRDAYEGGSWTPRIKAYLKDPLAENAVHDSADPNPFIGRWEVEYRRKPQESLGIQRDVLYELSSRQVPVAEELARLAANLHRFPQFLAALASSGVSPTIAREVDLQKWIHAILALLYVDIRPEDPMQIQGGASARPDFTIRDHNIALETKMTRESLSDRSLSEEIYADLGRYPSHPHCDAILVFIYDPARRIVNRSKFEVDLTDLEHETPRVVLVVD